MRGIPMSWPAILAYAAPMLGNYGTVKDPILGGGAYRPQRFDGIRWMW